MSKRVKGRRKDNEIVFESLDSQSPGRRGIPDHSENSVAIIKVEEEETPDIITDQI